MHNGHRRIAQGAALAGLAAAGLAIAHAGPGLTAIGPVRRPAVPTAGRTGQARSRGAHLRRRPGPGQHSCLPRPAGGAAPARHLLPARLHGGPGAAAGGRDRRGRARDRRPRLGPPVHDPARTRGGVQRPGPRQRRRVRGHRRAAPVLPSSLRCPQLGRRPGRAEAGADARSCGAAGEGNGRPAPPRIRCSPRWWPTSPAAQRSCSTTPIAPHRRGPPRRRSARCPGCWTSARPAGWPWGPWLTTVSGRAVPGEGLTRLRPVTARAPGSRNVVSSQERPKS